MGNVDSRSKNDHGYMIVQTAKPFYYPGEMVTGTVFLRSSHPLEVAFIDLEVKGREKVSFIERVTRHNNENNTSETEELKRKTNKQLLHFHHPCFTFAVSTLAPGDYAIPFAFTLPMGVPSSLYYKNKSILA